MRADSSLSVVKARYQRDLLARAHVVAVGLGLQKTAGRLTGSPAVKVFVTRKVPASQLVESDLVPHELQTSDGPVVTDVEEMAPLEAPLRSAGMVNEETPLLRTLHRPVFGGLSAAHYRFEVGTIAITVADALRPGDYLLSNNHVFALLNQASPGDAVVQPAPIDGGSPERCEIGTLERFIPIVFGGSVSNVVDAALATVRAESALLGRVAYASSPVGVRPARDLLIGETVHKVGRTTGLTFGHVVATAASCKINYAMTGLGNLTALFDDQILTSPMAGYGDSGSLLLDRMSNAVGMLSGGSATHTVFNACDVLEQLLQIRFVPPADQRPPFTGRHRRATGSPQRTK